MLINLLTTTRSSDNCLSHTLADIRHLATSLYGCRIIKVAREEVGVAHDLARASRNMSFPFSIH